MGPQSARCYSGSSHLKGYGHNVSSSMPARNDGTDEFWLTLSADSRADSFYEKADCRLGNQDATLWAEDIADRSSSVRF